MFCTFCGQRLESGDRFCGNCGTPVPQRQVESAARVAAAPAAAPPLPRVTSTAEMSRSIVAAQAPASESPVARAAERPESTAAAARAPEPIVEPPSRPGGIGSTNWLDHDTSHTAHEPEVLPPPPHEDYDTPAERWEEPDLPEPRPVVAQQAAPSVTPARPIPPEPHEVMYDSVGNELDAESPPMDLGRADVPTPSFGGYAAASNERPASKSRAEASYEPPRRRQSRTPDPVVEERPPRRVTSARRSRLPVLEIIVVILLVVGAGAAVWMLRSSLPGKSSTTTAPAAGIAVTISPTTAHVVINRSADLEATVSGTDDMRVTWTIQEGDAGGRIVTHGAKAANGIVSSTADYVAPKTPGTYHVVATSQANPSQSATAEITVTKR